MAGPERIEVEVVLAHPQHTFVKSLAVPAGTSLRQAIERSGVLEAVAGLELASLRVGVWGREKALDDWLVDGDRVEIYRPLECDPKQARRDRALRKRRGG